MPDFLIDPGPVQAEAGIGYVGTQFVTSAIDGLTASTTHTLAGALALPANFNRISTVVNIGDSVKLPLGYPGMSVCAINAGVNSMQVYAYQSVDLINGIAGSTGVAQMASSCVFYECTAINAKTGAATWFAQDLGVGTAGNYPTIAYQDALTASTTQTAAGGTPITSSMANFTTVVNANDAATLPPALPGMQVTVANNSGGSTMQVFAATQLLGGISGGDKIAGAASTTIANATVILFFCTHLGNWFIK